MKWETSPLSRRQIVGKQVQYPVASKQKEKEKTTISDIPLTNIRF